MQTPTARNGVCVSAKCEKCVIYLFIYLFIRISVEALAPQPRRLRARTSQPIPYAPQEAVQESPPCTCEALHRVFASALGRPPQWVSARPHSMWQCIALGRGHTDCHGSLQCGGLELSKHNRSMRVRPCCTLDACVLFASDVFAAQLIHCPRSASHSHPFAPVFCMNSLLHELPQDLRAEQHQLPEAVERVQ